MSDGSLLRMPEFLREARAEIVELSPERDVEKGSLEWGQLDKKVAKAYRKAHNRSENWARHIATLSRHPLRGDRPGAPGIEEHDEVGEGSSRRARQECKSRVRSEPEPAGCRPRAARLLDLRRSEEAGRRVWKVDPPNSSRECVGA